MEILDVKNYNEGYLTSAEANTVRRFVAERFTLEWAVPSNDELCVFLAYCNVAGAPEKTRDLIIKGCR